MRGRGAVAKGLWRTVAGRSALALAILVAVALLAPRVSYIEVRVFDLLYSLRPSHPPDPSVVVIDTGEDPSVYQSQSDPAGPPARGGKITRLAYAEAARRLHRWGAAVIVFDLMFTEPHPGEDGALAEAFREAGNVIVAATANPKEGVAVSLEDPDNPIRDAVWAVGSPVVHSPNNIVRSVPLTVTDCDSGRRYETISLLAYECLRGAAPGSAVSRGDVVVVAGVRVPVVPEERIRLLRLGGSGVASSKAKQNAAAFKVVSSAKPTLVPETTTWDAMLINWAGPGGSFELSGLDELLSISSDEEGRRHFGGKAVLIGRVGSESPFSTAVGSVSGLEVHANALNTLVSGKFVRALPTWGMLGIIGFFVVVTGLAASRFRGVRSAGVVLILMAASAVSARQLMAGWGVWMYLFCCDLGIALAWGTTSIAESSRMAEVLLRLIPSFMQRPGAAVPAGVRTMDASVLFSDIRGYTGTAEQLSAAELMNVMSRYRAAAEEIIARNGGTIVKTPGDAILAIFWREAKGRSHASCALQAGQDLLSWLPAMTEAWLATGATPRIGVGVNAGQVAMGLVGTRHLEPTVVGDAVNVAERLEELTKTLGCPLVFGESVRQRLPAEVEVVRLDEVTVRGREAPLVVYGLRSMVPAGVVAVPKERG
ncbi:MAG: CHASE2 domain-containing protein [Armatimonadota bacterium]